MTLSVQPPGQDDAADLVLADLIEQFTARVEAGEAVDVDAFLAEHPDHAERLRRVLPGVQVLAALKVSDCAGDGAAETPAPLGAGTLGDFRIIREVGRGGMGVVYEAEQVSLRRRVALKVLPLAGVLDPRHLLRFQNEAQAAACLHHTNIVPVYFVGSERGVHYYAMQFIDGQTLAALIGQLRQPADHTPEEQTTAYQPPRPAADTESLTRQLTQSGAGSKRGREYYRRVAGLGAQAAEALDHAHQMGIVHRDVKPGNLMLDGSGRLWVTDFGLAHIQHGEASLTRTGDLVGTLRYMSPEQALAKRVPIDHRTDVYSLGVTLYELLTLRPACDGKDRAELLRQIAFDEPARPRKLDRGIPAELETIVLKAVEKNPADRYATAKELADDLRNWLEDRAIQARRPSLRQVAAKWARRHRVAVTAGAVCLLVTLTAVVGSVGWVLGDRGARQRVAEARVREALEAAAPGLRQGNPHDPMLIEAGQRAEAQLDAGVLGPGLRGQVEQLLRDQHMLAQLEKARLQSAVSSKQVPFDFAGADRLYAGAFEWYGLDVTALSLQDAAQRVWQSAIGTHLTAGLDDWAFARDHLVERGGAPLRAVADLADEDPWRRRLREAAGRGDRDALERLADERGVLSQPPTTLVLLATSLRDNGSRAAAERLLRQAQPSHPTDFWINFKLANSLDDKPPSAAEAVGFYRAALALRPQSAAVYNNLGGAWEDLGKPAEAEAAYEKAIALQPDLAVAHYNLGVALKKRGKLPEAIAAYRKAIDHKPDFVFAYNNLGNALVARGQFGEAVAALQKAVELAPDDAWAHRNLGIALRDQGKRAEAATAFQRATEVQPDFVEAHMDLGFALLRQGRPAEAAAAFQRAIKLQPDYAGGHNALGIALQDQGKSAEAAAVFQRAIELQPDYAEAHNGLGLALKAQGKLAEAVEVCGKAIKLKPDLAAAHGNLGKALLQQGRFADALRALKRAHELGSQQPGWRSPYAQSLREAERLAELDVKLSKILRGDVQPRDALERMGLADVCISKGHYASAVRFVAEAFAEQPNLADDLRYPRRYNAACAAALAGCGQGKDVEQSDDQERGRLRRQALDWLRADLEAWRRLLDKEPDKAGPAVRGRMRHWLADTDLAGVRGAEALKRLPEAERADWQRLWEEVEALRQRAAAAPQPGAVQPKN
jgi:tetratricopeptide (TPR) repeat protein